MNPTTNIPLSTITTSINLVAGQTKTAEQKRTLYEVTAEIAERNKELPRDQFFNQCGVSPEWGTLKAAA